MKTTKLFFTGIFFFLILLGLQAQNKTGVEYFKGTWDVNVSSSYGTQKMMVVITQDGDKLVGAINDDEGKELFKVNSTSVEEKQVTINFNGSQGAVDMRLRIKDENLISVSIMGGMAYGTGERQKE